MCYKSILLISDSHNLMKLNINKMLIQLKLNCIDKINDCLIIYPFKKINTISMNEEQNESYEELLAFYKKTHDDLELLYANMTEDELEDAEFEWSPPSNDEELSFVGRFSESQRKRVGELLKHFYLNTLDEYYLCSVDEYLNKLEIIGLEFDLLNEMITYPTHEDWQPAKEDLLLYKNLFEKHEEFKLLLAGDMMVDAKILTLKAREAFSHAFMTDEELRKDYEERVSFRPLWSSACNILVPYLSMEKKLPFSVQELEILEDLSSKNSYVKRNIENSLNNIRLIQGEH